MLLPSISSHFARNSDIRENGQKQRSETMWDAFPHEQDPEASYSAYPRIGFSAYYNGTFNNGSNLDFPKD
jgi:hypothetical protein